MAEEAKALSKDSTKVVYREITRDVPEDKVRIQKLDDGYSVSVDCRGSKEEDGMKAEFSSSYFSERHFPRRVRAVKGLFNDKGEYEVSIDFERE